MIAFLGVGAKNPRLLVDGGLARGLLIAANAISTAAVTDDAVDGCVGRLYTADSLKGDVVWQGTKWRVIFFP